MGNRDFDQFAVLSSYVNSSEIYRGNDAEKARTLAVTHGDKCTLYTLTKTEEGVHLEIVRHYGDGRVNSVEGMEINSREIKHLKTLISLID